MWALLEALDLLEKTARKVVENWEHAPNNDLAEAVRELAAALKKLD